MKQHTVPFLLLAATLLLSACVGQEPVQTVYEGSGPAVPESVDPVPAEPASNAFARSMLLADILYEAKMAQEDNRLLSPAGDNAYDRYRQVLELDPGNAVALEGIQEIVLRYVGLAEVAMSQGKFAEARSLLDRGASLNPERPELLAALERLEGMRNTRVDRFDIDPQGLAEQNLDVMVRLSEIAQQIMRSDATFLINARTDAEGRWIYKVMREAVGGYRLRGNIDISSTPGILVTMPAG